MQWSIVTLNRLGVKFFLMLKQKNNLTCQTHPTFCRGLAGIKNKVAILIYYLNGSLFRTSVQNIAWLINADLQERICKQRVIYWFNIIFSCYNNYRIKRRDLFVERQIQSADSGHNYKSIFWAILTTNKINSLKLFWTNNAYNSF